MSEMGKSDALFDRVAGILEEARGSVVRSVNHAMVAAYWLIGREIVEEEQQGRQRARYGDRLLEDLSRRLRERFGKGYSVTGLRDYRKLYLIYSQRDIKRHAVRVVSSGGAASTESDVAPEKTKELVQRDFFDPNLSWTHYRLLMRVEAEHARSFYEVEAARNRWSSRQLERQINSFLFERLAKSRDRQGVLALAKEGEQPEKAIDIIKDPFVLEFLDLPEGAELVESKVEQALVGRLRKFLLELGSGFAFVARQPRLTLDGDHFYVDLVFYHVKLKCYVLIDIKVKKLTHGDLGQMQFYVNYYDREVRSADDNPSVGLILCADKNDAMVQYTLAEGQEQVFTSRYRLYLPTEDELARELRRELAQVVKEAPELYVTAGN
jgi:predicted nuclease of restriction endonuclease-like (RecB) superfamily